MMKMIGAVLILLGFAGLSSSYVEKMKRRMRLLRDWSDVLEVMEGEVRYGRLSLPECFLKVGMQCRSIIGSKMEKIGKELLENPEKDMKTEVIHELGELLEKSFSPEEQESLFCFFYAGGCPDDQMQRRAMERNRQKVEETLSVMKESFRGKTKVAFCLGTMAGMVVVLLLI